ncbi:MAG: VirB8/TrbF family protein [Candidatus Andeanibacterium colombiense]|uniref:VirB8/TrbF family protein n=1 Tax=Candidatus Andeanibacterium colombiense TaxID=3121345 RepID=A0AAJ5X5V3_9SPHN|nr:MAG: VirB8/TrbF family protein [Sphingomonadaceae bacterium]
MNDLRNEKLEDYYEAAESWSADRNAAQDRSRRTAWIVAGVAAAVALFEAIALVLLIPLKKEVPYTLLVDRQTGYVEALRPLEQRTLTPDAALTRSFLVQYVIARESFDAETLQENYRKVGLWSAGEARDRYVSLMQASNREGPLATLPKAARVDVRIRSVSSLRPDQSLVRFDTVRTDRGSSAEYVEHWAAVINFRFSDAGMSAEDRLVNPLGFQVMRYRKDPETLPVVNEVQATPPGVAAPAAAPQPGPTP